MDEQEFYDSLWNEFKDSDDPGTFTSWLVNKMGVINVYIERLRTELSQARRAQGVPHERYRALEMDNQRLRDQLQDDRTRRPAPPPVRQPWPTPNPDTAEPLRWVQPGRFTETPGDTPDWGPGGAGPVNWDDLRAMENLRTQDNDPRRRPDAVGEQRRIEELRERIARMEADAQDRDRG